MRELTPLGAMLAVAIAAIVSDIALPSGSAQAAPAITAQEAHDIAAEAYLYFYPLVSMDASRRQLTNIEPGKMPGREPMNTFSHLRTYPDAISGVRPISTHYCYHA